MAVDLHPRPDEPDRRTRAFFGEFGLAVRATLALAEAFAEAEAYTSALVARNRGAGFLKSLLLQRICSSSTAGLATTLAIARKASVPDADGTAPTSSVAAVAPAHLAADDDDQMFDLADLGEPSEIERDALGRLLGLLREAASAAPTGGDADPKLQVLRHYLHEVGLVDGRQGWLAGHGCIVFSQYYDTARWVADCLAAEFATIPVGLYAGAGRSGIYKDGCFEAAERPTIKAAVRDHKIRLLIATDAACEGLNLQTLGTLVNLDLPWNPLQARAEARPDQAIRPVARSGRYAEPRVRRLARRDRL